jgi:hypothetical protein
MGGRRRRSLRGHRVVVRAPGRDGARASRSGGAVRSGQGGEGIDRGLRRLGVARLATGNARTEPEAGDVWGFPWREVPVCPP